MSSDRDSVNLFSPWRPSSRPPITCLRHQGRCIVKEKQEWAPPLTPHRSQGSGIGRASAPVHSVQSASMLFHKVLCWAARGGPLGAGIPAPSLGKRTGEAGSGDKRAGPAVSWEARRVRRGRSPCGPFGSNAAGGGASLDRPRWGMAFGAWRGGSSTSPPQVVVSIGPSLLPGRRFPAPHRLTFPPAPLLFFPQSSTPEPSGSDATHSGSPCSRGVVLWGRGEGFVNPEARLCLPEAAAVRRPPRPLSPGESRRHHV